MRTILRLTVMLLAVPAFLGAQGTPSAMDLASRIQARYNTVRDFTADFSLTQTSPLLVRPLTEHGTVKIKKPDRMRWNYTSTDKKVFVADGSRFYAYSPQDRLVREQKLPAADESSTALLFLAGRANLTRDFVPSVPAAQPASEWQLTLKPKSGAADFQTLTLEVDRSSLALRGFVVVDEQGGTSKFRFTRLEENRNLPDSDFVFVMPQNVEIRRQ